MLYNKILSFNIKSINKIQVSTHWNICLYPINIYCSIFVSYELFSSFRNVFNSKAIKLCYIIIIHLEIYPMSSYWFIISKIYYTYPILYFRWIVSWINSFKFRFILKLFLSFKIGERMQQHQKSCSALNALPPALITPLPADTFSNKVAPNVPDSKWRNAFYCFLD